MTQEIYFEKVFKTAFIEAHDEKDTFFQSLYTIIQSKQAEKPTYSLFFDCLIDAFETPSTWSEDKKEEIFWGNTSIIATPDNDFDELLYFVLVEAYYFYKSDYYWQNEIGYFYDQTPYQPFNILTLIYQTLFLVKFIIKDNDGICLFLLT